MSSDAANVDTTSAAGGSSCSWPQAAAGAQGRAATAHDAVQLLLPEQAVHASIVQDRDYQTASIPSARGFPVQSGICSTCVEEA